MRVPWTARRSSQFILKEISPEYSLEGPMLKLRLQSFGHLMRRTDSLEKTLMLGKTEGRRRRGRQRIRCFLICYLGWSWRRQWQPTPVLLPGEFHGRRSLVGCSPWGHEELDRTERLHFHFSVCTAETKFCMVKTMAFPVALYGCEIWTIKKAEH